MADIKERIARRVAKEMHDGDIANLGIGLPTLVAKYIPEISSLPCIPRTDSQDWMRPGR